MRPLKPARHCQNIILPWSELPAWTEVATERFLERGTTNDPFDLSRPLNAWRPATIKTYRTLLRRFFSAMRCAGCDFEGTTSLRDVANYEVAERPLRWMQQAAKRGRGFAMAANTAVLLAQIALNPEQREKLSEAEKSANKVVSAKLQELAGRLRSEPGLSAKVRERLKPLKDEGNLASLFLLPFGLEREVRRAKGRPRQVALLLQWAVVLMLLAFCPLRISTLCSIEDRHLSWSRPKRRGDLTLELEGVQQKNGEPESIPLPVECARIIKLYLDDYRHLLHKKSTTFLFPGGTPCMAKKPGVLSTQITRLIFDRTGFKVNPHLYRHMVHLIILRRFPGAYVMISRILTHKSLETAVRNYSYFDTELSMKAYHQLVREVQDGTSSQKSASLSSVAYNHSEFKHGSR